MTLPVFTIPQILGMAKESKLGVDEFAQAISVYEERREAAHAARASSVEDRKAISTTISTMFQQMDGELSQVKIDDILEAARVSKKQGTVAFARQEKKRQLLLTHQPR